MGSSDSLLLASLIRHGVLIAAQSCLMESLLNFEGGSVMSKLFFLKYFCRVEYLKKAVSLWVSVLFLYK